LVAARRLRSRRRADFAHRASQNAVEKSAPNATLSAQPPHLNAPASAAPGRAVGGERPQPHVDAAPELQVLATARNTAADDSA